MPNNTSYTPEEVAHILKISKYTVYELIKRGELAAYRVGRKVRVEEPDIERYKQRSKAASSPSDTYASQDQTSALTIDQPLELSRPLARTEDSLVICGQDVMLDILTRHLLKQYPNLKFFRNYMGSIDGLLALYRGEANLATVHLWDSDTGDYNLPYIRRLMPGHQTVVINLAFRMEGFYVRRGNPKKIMTWKDLARPDIRFINRERGSGARVLLDEKLRLESIPHHLINGYFDEEHSHMAIASKVARGEADVGLGIEKAALQVPELDFISLHKERYDLVLREEDLNKPIFQALLTTIRSPEYRKEVEGLGGYDVSRMGEIME
ncbi:helix-turn-helix transcriptional regulator [Dehalobacter sp. DCM]|uniref:helix-turn-helix transcriptional regulator n=1 Tax=Dehalobacter sp. DCM TaxID=2907827 RepID=UPI003081C263|nr:helix-turn-helix transcriptional regulator [Dehalobacter sp. DCM]